MRISTDRQVQLLQQLTGRHEDSCPYRIAMFVRSIGLEPPPVQPGQTASDYVATIKAAIEEPCNEKAD